MTLKTCGKTGCNPVEQVRGAMGAGDYHDVVAAHQNRGGMGGISDPSKYGAPANPDKWADGDDDGHHAEVNDSNRDDYRIVCTTCGKATGWNKQNVEGMPGVGKTFTQTLWNEKTGA